MEFTAGSSFLSGVIRGAASSEVVGLSFWNQEMSQLMADLLHSSLSGVASLSTADVAGVSGVLLLGTGIATNGDSWSCCHFKSIFIDNIFTTINLLKLPQREEMRQTLSFLQGSFSLFRVKKD
jgi:hypothetical protein